MPTYELGLLVRYTINQAQAALLMKNLTEVVLAKGGIVRKIENLSTDNLPYRIRAAHTREWHKSARHMTFLFDASPQWISEIGDYAKVHQEVIRSFLVRVPTPELVTVRRASKFGACPNLATGNPVDDNPLTFETQVLDGRAPVATPFAASFPRPAKRE